MNTELIKRIITSLILTFVLIFSLFYSQNSWNILISIFLIICFYEFFFLIKKIIKNNIIKTSFLFLIIIYLYLFYLLVTNIRYEFGKEAILILLIACILSDIGGYIIGKTFGGPKLTSISPNKTISGAFGSIVFTIIGTFLFIIFLIKMEKKLFFLENITLKIFLWLFVMSVLCQLGDLIISYLKRKANVKDTGNILPGHGGLLDRVDGIIIAVPFGALIYFVL